MEYLVVVLFNQLITKNIAKLTEIAIFDIAIKVKNSITVLSTSICGFARFNLQYVFKLWFVCVKKNSRSLRYL